MTPRRRSVLAAVAALALAAGASAGIGAGGAQDGQGPGMAAPGGLEVLRIRDNFYMIAGAGSNVAVQIGDDGVVVVDSGALDHADAVVETIRTLTPHPIRYVINTSADADHVGGNAAVAMAGESLFVRGGPGLPVTEIIGGGASILMTDGAVARLGEVADLPDGAWPSETFHQPRKNILLNGEGIEIVQQPAAHTDGDAIVFFRRSDVIVAGDIFDTTRFPVIDVDRGGSVQGVIAALNRLSDMAIISLPIVSREGGTIVIPGHGRLSDQIDVVEYRDMVTIVRDRIQGLIDAGQSLAQIRATSPARGYVNRYGSDTGPWTTDDFVEAVYRSLVEGRS